MLNSIKKNFSKNSLIDFLIYIINFFFLKLLKFKVFNTSLDIKKKKLIKKYTNFSKSKIQNGLYQGIYLKEKKDIYQNFSSKISGVYEEVVQKKINAILIENKIDYFINIGTSEGFHFLGVLKNHTFKESFAIDIDQKATEILKYNLSKNKEIIKKNKINVLNSFNIDNLFNYSPNAFFLIDIEGDEINFFNKENIKKFIYSNFIIEFHFDSKKFLEKEFLNDNEKKFYDLIYDNFNVSLLKHQISKSPFDYIDNMDNFFNEDEIFLLLSESRDRQISWLVLNPK